MRPKFEKGDSIYHELLKKQGTVQKCINEEDVDDVLAQGFRYLVDFRNGTWSCLEQNMEKHLSN